MIFARVSLSLSLSVRREAIAKIKSCGAQTLFGKKRTQIIDEVRRAAKKYELHTWGVGNNGFFFCMLGGRAGGDIKFISAHIDSRAQKINRKNWRSAPMNI